MTIASSRPPSTGRPSGSPVRVIEPELIVEHVGLDDQSSAHGGQSRRSPSPPFPAGLVQRVPPPVLLPTAVRRLHAG